MVFEDDFKISRKQNFWWVREYVPTDSDYFWEFEINQMLSVTKNKHCKVLNSDLRTLPYSYYADHE